MWAQPVQYAPAEEMSRPAHPTEIRAEGNDDAVRQTLYEFCCRNNKDLLFLQWDTEKNDPDTPRQVTAGTMRKVWWRCVLGHSWRAAVFPRVQKGGGLSLLCGAEGPSRLQRPCLQVARRGGPVEPSPQRRPDAGNGNGQQPPQGLVAVSPGPCMEGSGLLPHGGAEVRLSGLRRLSGRGPQGPV